MYESYFNLQRRPFAAIPDPSCCYLAGSSLTVLDELVVCLERGEGIAILTAPPGTGKTLFCQRIKQELSGGFQTVFLRHANFESPKALLQTLLAELKIATSAQSEQELRLHLEAALTTLRSRKQGLVLICDEAHRLEEPLLEELRTLTDLADHGVPWVRLLLAGQLELEEKLAAPGLAAFNQRLRSSVSLPTLTRAESADYIDYRITWAGGRTEEIFLPETVLAITDAADGVPRCLNQLCDHVLLLAYVAEEQPASPQLVEEALSDLKHLPLNWNIRSRRDPAHDLLESPPRSLEVGKAEPQFGEHLATWESSPLFETSREESSPSNSEVWEFGLDDSDAETDLPESLPTARPIGSSFETRPERISSSPLRDRAPLAADKPREETVIDRYAAIDGGWWHEEQMIRERSADKPADEIQVTRRTEQVSAPAPTIRSDWQAITTGDESSVYELSPSARIVPLEPTEMRSPFPTLEQSLQADVLDLVATTQAAVKQSPIEKAMLLSDSASAFESDVIPLEEPEATSQAEARPLRNLFTRLRRKQKGLG